MKVPYKLIPALAVEDRFAQMAYSVQIAKARGYPRLQRAPIDDTRTMHIACYGPSLHETFEALRGQSPIMSMSGATRFLADRGIVPDYHIDMDPRPYKANHLKPPVDGVHYLMASVSPAETWEILKDQRVTLWHTNSGTNSAGLSTEGWVALHDQPGELVLHGGSTIGLTAIHLGGELGYRHFEIHGMDGSFKDGERHAGVHFGKKYTQDYTWNAEGRTYHTTQIMSNAVAETINMITGFPVFCVFHGDGLTQALVREANRPNACTANQIEKVALVRAAYVRRLDMPRIAATQPVSYWDALIDRVPPATVVQLMQFARKAEKLRPLAKYNTGTIPIETALLLRGLTTYYRPKVIAEVGTFIGTSTYALEAAHVLYTCDRDNNCLAADPARHIVVNPFLTSTQMFQRMLNDGFERRVDLFFLDGRLTHEDLPLIQRLGHARTVFALDDCSQVRGANKGLHNLALLKPLLPDHAIIGPHQGYHGRSTLGALVPLIEESLARDVA